MPPIAGQNAAGRSLSWARAKCLYPSSINMNSIFLATTCVVLLASQPAAQEDFVVPAGQTVRYDTANGPIRVRNLTIEIGGRLRASGEEPFIVHATGEIIIDGIINFGGASARDVSTINTGSIPELGANGGTAAGRGGSASIFLVGSTPAGTDGQSADPLFPFAPGSGGESGFADANLGQDARRPGGGGGGALGPNQSRDPDPSSPLNRGLIAESGFAGHPLSTGAQSGESPARGGSAGTPIGQDGNPKNDFFGLVNVAGTTQMGELSHPMAGNGGGAGGDAVPSSSFPHPRWTTFTDNKGGAGGGGGGLGMLVASRISIGAMGQVKANGGAGAAGENFIFIDRIGGGGGGGSGGFILLRAQSIDLSAAGIRALSAIGGRGGKGANNVPGAINAGGSGGPGFIQLHTPDGMNVILPAGQALSDISSPAAKSLLYRFR